MSYEINERLALLLGWKPDLEGDGDTWISPEHRWTKPGIPDFSGDLNEIREYEKRLVGPWIDRYERLLTRICIWDGNSLVMASAEQKTRAMIELLEGGTP